MASPGAPPNSQAVAVQPGDEIVAGAEQFGWDVHKGDIAKIWRAGCIIRARFLNRIAEAYALAGGRR